MRLTNLPDARGVAARVDGTWRDLSKAAKDAGQESRAWSSVDSIAQHGIQAKTLKSMLASAPALADDFRPSGAVLRAPPKIIAIARNFPNHAREQGKEPPKAPVAFAKLPTSIIGPGETIHWDPAITQEVDWEAELGVVIGKRATRVSASAAWDHVLGFVVANDVTARDLQRSEGQYVRAKGLDTFLPLGSQLILRDEVPKPERLAVRSRLNGQPMQDARLDELLFDIPTLIAHYSAGFTLMPGDLLLTGTPPGVGAFRDPPRFLREGDVVEVEVEGLETVANPCQPLRT